MAVNNPRWLLAVVRRDRSEAAITCLKRNGACHVYGTLCEGAAKKKTLDMLGLEPREKMLLSSFTDGPTARTLLRKLVTELRIDAPNSGIALTVRMDGTEEEVTKMGKNCYSLIIAISEKGRASEVLDAARDGGARGGTIVHAREIEADQPSKFFGVSIAKEKEQIYIVVPEAQRESVISAINEKAGAGTKANASAFSLPVESSVGLAIPIEP